MLPGLKGLTLLDRLKVLNLPTLMFCGLRGDCIQVFKYLHKCYAKLLIFHCTWGNQLKLCKLPQYTQLRGNFFGLRVVNNWNALPDDVQCLVMAPKVNAFKNHLNKLWKNHLLRIDPNA